MDIVHRETTCIFVHNVDGVPDDGRAGGGGQDGPHSADDNCFKHRHVGTPCHYTKL